jgi:outer membrane lipoprotein LolB
VAKGAAEISRRSHAAKSHAAVHTLKPAIRTPALCVALLALLTIAGCARQGSLDAGESAQQRWSAHRRALADYQTWDLHARAVVWRASEVYNVGLQWRQDTRQFVMLLEAPFGQGVFRIDNGTDGGYRLLLPDGQVFENRTPEALLEEVFGWSLPISGLRYWIRGLPRPGSEYRDRLDNTGLARSLDQDRWSIEFREYFDAGREPQLPRRLNLARDDLSIKLVIERWQRAEVEQQDAELFPEFD